MAESSQSRGDADGILSGRKIAAEVRSQAAEELTQLKKEHPDFEPGLTIVQVCMYVYVHVRTQRLTREQ